MSELDDALAAGGKVVESDLDRALREGGKEESPPRTPSGAESFGLGAVHGGTFGTAPAIAKKATQIGSIFPVGLRQWMFKKSTGIDVPAEVFEAADKNPEAVAQAYREGESDAQKANPKLYAGGQIAGTLAVPIPGAGAVKAGTLLGKVGLRAAEGAAVGGLSGAGEAIGEGKGAGEIAKRGLTGAIGGGVAGGVLGGTGDIIGRALGRAAGKLAEKSEILRRKPTLEAVDIAEKLHLPESGRGAIAREILNRIPTGALPIAAGAGATYLAGEGAENVAHGGVFGKLKGVGELGGAAVLGAMAGKALGQQARGTFSSAMDRLRIASQTDARAQDLLGRIVRIGASQAPGTLMPQDVQQTTGVQTP